MRRGAKWALVGLAGVGTLAVATVALLSDQQATTTLTRDALAHFRQQIPAQIRFNSVAVDALSGHVTIDQPVLSLPNHPGEPLAKAKQVIATIAPIDLLRGKLTITALTLVDPDVTVIHRGGNDYNVIEALPKQQGPKNPHQRSNFALNHVTIVDGTLTYLDDPRRIRAKAPNLQAAVGLNLDTLASDGTVSFAKGWLKAQGLNRPLDRFDGAFRFDGHDLSLNRLQLLAGGTELGVRGAIQGLKDGPGKLRLDGMAKSPLAPFSPLAKTALAGDLAADFGIGGTLKAPEIAATLTGSKLAAKGFEVPSLKTRVQATRDQVKIAGLDARIWGGRLLANGDVPLTKQGALNLDAIADGIDLVRVRQAVKLKLQADLVGRLNAHVHARGHGLDPRALSATGQASLVGQVGYHGRTLPLTVDTQLAWAAGQLTIDQAHVLALGGRLDAHGTVTPRARVPHYSAAGTLTRLPITQLAAFSPKPLGVAGTLSGAFSIAGSSFKAPALSGSARLSCDATLLPKAAGNRRAIPLAATAHIALAGHTLKLERLDADALGGHLAAHGDVALVPAGPPRLALAGNLAGVSLAALNADYPFAKGPIGGRADARWAFNGQTLRIDQLTARTLGGVLQGHGTIALAPHAPRYALNVHVQHVDLAKAQAAFLPGRAPLSGHADAALNLSGSGKNFQASGPIRLAGRALVPSPALKAQTVEPFTLSSNLTVSPGFARVSPLVAHFGRSTLTAQGQVALNGLSDLHFNGNLQDAPAIASLLGVRRLTAGSLRLDGRVQGPRGHMTIAAHAQLGPTRLDDQAALKQATLTLAGALTTRLTLNGQLNAQGLSVSRHPIASLQVPFHYDAAADRLAAGTLNLKNLVMRFTHGQFGGNAMLDLDRRRYAVAMATQHMVLGDLGGQHPRLTSQPSDSADTAPFSLSVTGQGAIAHPSLTTRTTLGGFHHGGHAFGPSAIAAQLHDDRLALSGHLLGDQLSLAGDASTVGALPGRLALTFRNTQLAPLFALAPASLADQVQLPNNGLLAGSVTIAGPLKRPNALTADVNLSRFAISYPDLRFDNDGPLRIAYADHRLALNAFHLVGTNTDLSAAGTLGLGLPSHLSTTGTLNLALLEKLSPREFADASGTATFEGQLAGTLGAPDLSGALSIRSDLLATRNLPQPLHDLNASVRLVHDRLFLDTLTATLGYTGRVRAFGSADLGTNFLPSAVSLQATARELQVRVPDVSMLANADLTFSGTPDDSHLTGSVTVLDGHFTKNIDLTGGLLSRTGSAPSGGTGGTAWQNLPFVRNLQLQLQLAANNAIAVNNNLANLTAGGNLLVLGTPARPVIVGRAEAAPGGQVNFQDVTYQLQEASIDFIDPHVLTPYLHVTANADVDAYTVTIQANGTPKALKLDLSSQPFLPQQDILTLLATGQTTAGLQNGGGLATAGNLLLNQVAGSMTSGGAGLVDVLKIQPGSVNQSQLLGAGAGGGESLTVGKRINDRLTLSYSQDIAVQSGQTPDRVITFDYALTHALGLTLEQDLSGGFNASARYRFNFR